MYPQITQISQIRLAKGHPGGLLACFRKLTEEPEDTPELSPT